MNDLQGDKEISALDQAAINDLKERDNYVASNQLQAWKELSKLEAFKVPMQRIREKREARERSICGGVSPEKYPILVAEVALLRELEAMPQVERLACFKQLNPGLASEPKD